MDDILELLGVRKRVSHYIEVSPSSLKAWKILVKGEENGFFIQQDGTRSAEVFCAPYSEELELAVNGIFQQIRAVRDEAKMRESKLLRELFNMLKDKREAK